MSSTRKRARRRRDLRVARELGIGRPAELELVSVGAGLGELGRSRASTLRRLRASGHGAGPWALEQLERLELAPRLALELEQARRQAGAHEQRARALHTR